MALTVFDAIDVMTSYQHAATLTAAARCGVFDVLAQRPLTWAETAEELGTDPSATRALLDALVGLGLLDTDGTTGTARYVVGPVAARLGADGDLRLVVEKEAFLARQWLELEASVRSGRPRMAPWRERLDADPGQVREFLAALLVLARETGPDLPGALGAGPGTRVADLGGGLGAYAVPFAAAGADVTLVDLPLVIQWAREDLAAQDAATRGRIELCAADLLAPDAEARIGAGHDVVLLSHLLHDLDDDDAAAALDLARRLTRPGGSIVVFELPGDPPGAFGPLFDLMMRVETPGAARRADELVALLVAAGCGDVAEVPGTGRPHLVLRGVVPA